MRKVSRDGRVTRYRVARVAGTREGGSPVTSVALFPIVRQFLSLRIGMEHR